MKNLATSLLIGIPFLACFVMLTYGLMPEPAEASMIGMGPRVAALNGAVPAYPVLSDFIAADITCNATPTNVHPSQATSLTTTHVGDRDNFNSMICSNESSTKIYLDGVSSTNQTGYPICSGNCAYPGIQLDTHRGQIWCSASTATTLNCLFGN